MMWADGGAWRKSKRPPPSLALNPISLGLKIPSHRLKLKKPLSEEREEGERDGEERREGRLKEEYSSTHDMHVGPTFFFLL